MSTTTRIEHDSMGEIRVQSDRLWGAQTQRSLENFRIGVEKMPPELILAMIRVKAACAQVNAALGRLDQERADAILAACGEILSGGHADQFPLSVWQTGSGTQTNMNCNEVIAIRASQIMGAAADAERPVHPNDHVNMSQSSNDTFPTAMHVAAVMEIERLLLPAVARLQDTFMRKRSEFGTIVKIGRTHLQDATPLTLGQETGAWAAILASACEQVGEALRYLRDLAIGGTAVGTGINAPAGFGEQVAAELTRLTGTRFRSAPDKFQALSSHDAMAFASGALRTLAAGLMKIANDVRWLASGPRCGLGEISIPANEPGSSIMPGKVNPTQAEALTMVACQVMGNDACVGLAASQGNFQLNVYKPVIAYNFLQSVRLLGDAMNSFNDHCAAGITPNLANIDAHLHDSLMLVTALNPHVGYENAAKIARYAFAENCTLREAGERLGILSGEEFDRLVVPADMVGPSA